MMTGFWITNKEEGENNEEWEKNMEDMHGM